MAVALTLMPSPKQRAEYQRKASELATPPKSPEAVAAAAAAAALPTADTGGSRRTLQEQKVRAVARAASRRSFSRASRSSRDEISSEALEIMRLTDRHAHNGQITIIELVTFLRGTQHNEFCDWLVANRARVFKRYDVDDDEDLDVHELEKALRQ